MKNKDLKEFFDELYYGHDITFEHKTTKYFIEHSMSGLELYQLENGEEGTLVDSLSCKNKDELINNFLNQKMLPNNQSILDVFNEIKIIDIE